MHWAFTSIINQFICYQILRWGVLAKWFAKAGSHPSSSLPLMTAKFVFGNHNPDALPCK